VSQEIIDGLRSAYRHFADGDFSAYARLPDDFVLKVAPEMPDAGSYRGAAAREWLAAWVNSFDRLTLEATQFIDGGERVAIEVIQRGWFKGSDTPAELRHWAVVKVRDGSLSRTELFLTRGEALEAAGLSR